MKKLEKLLKEFENNIPNQKIVNTKVSEASVGWHIEHALLVINGIITTTKNSNPIDYKWSFNLPRTVTFIKGDFPRGRAKAPKSVVPKTEFNIESLKNHLSETHQNLKDLQVLDAKNHFIHPMFGKLNLKQTIKFLGIHTRHHVDIINDILKTDK